MVTPTMTSTQTPPNIPSITICISTQTSTFDLCPDKPFVITVTLTLRYHRPITFRARDTEFFQRPLYSPGLEFVNIRTGETQVGMTINVCYIGANDSEIPDESNRQEWITLHPGQPYTLDASIEPMSGKGRWRTFAEMESGSNEKFTSMKWPNVHLLLDGEMYKIQVNEKACVKWWVEGHLEEILQMVKDGRTPALLEEAIHFDVKETAEFRVKRPDLDGSLNWP
jgi:hypothetical protein